MYLGQSQKGLKQFFSNHEDKLLSFTSNAEPHPLLDTVELAQHDEDVEEHDGEAGVEEVVVAQDVLVDHVVEPAVDKDSNVEVLVASGQVQKVFL